MTGPLVGEAIRALHPPSGDRMIHLKNLDLKVYLCCCVVMAMISFVTYKDLVGLGSGSARDAQLSAGDGGDPPIVVE